MEMSGERHTPANHFTPAKEPWYPLSRRLSGTFEDEGKNLFFHTRIQTPDCPNHI
jgi:hypothetical protein